jgi:hypothetical protein
MESASRIIERTLGQNDSSIDILKNYKNDENLRSEDQILSVEAMYEDESVRSRPVMYLQSSPHFSELFLAAYGAKGVKQGKTVLGPLGGESLGSPGMVAVWSHVVSTYVWCVFISCLFTDFFPETYIWKTEKYGILTMFYLGSIPCGRRQIPLH